MQIYCPKCKTGYEIDASVVPETGRKLRCAVCQKVFKCMPQDLVDGSKLRQAEFTEEEKKHLDEKGHLQEEEISITAQVEERENEAEPSKADTAEENVKEAQEAETTSTEVQNSSQEETQEETTDEEGTQKTLDELASDNSYVKDIFERLSTETQNLFQSEQEEPKSKKVVFGLKKMFGIVNPRNIKYYVISFVILLLLVMYYARYEIVRTMPAMENIYNLFAIESVIPGEGLEFQNVVRREFEEDYVPKLEIKGFISNQTENSKEIPLIRIELLDKDGKSIQYKIFNSVLPVVPRLEKVPFSFVVVRPSPLTKYVYLTFVPKAQ